MDKVNDGINIFIFLQLELQGMQEAKFVCLEDFKKLAKEKMAPGDFNYLESGAEQQITKRRNQQAFYDLVIVPRVLRDISDVDLSVQVFGKKCSLPFGFTAWAANKLVNHQYGELIPSKVAKKNNICYVLSTLSNTHPKKIYEQNKGPNSSNLPNPHFLQLYLSTQQTMNNKLIQLAEDAHFDGLVITVDTQILGIRNKEFKERPNLEGLQYPILEQLRKVGKWEKGGEHGNQETFQDKYRKMRDLGLNWEKIRKIREKTHLKIILKGILHPQDALIAADYCDAIYISNHGGRQLDTVSATIQVLPKISAVLATLPKEKKRPKIFIDGGVRGGSDIFKCLALGADYIFLGRPVAYALSDGEHGVENLVSILKDELKRTMILAGVGNLKDINQKYLGFRSKI